MDYIRRCKEYIESHLKPSRIRHIEGVCETAVQLARIYGVDEEKAYTAALFHDICKSMTEEECNAEVKKYNLSDELLNNRNLAHGPVAACIARDEYGITDEDILNAITYHTVARKGMSPLEKIIYVSDAVEPGRTYGEAESLRNQAQTDLQGVFRFILEWSIEDIAKKGFPVSRFTKEAFDEIKGEKLMKTIELAKLAAKTLDDKKAKDVVIIDIAEKSGFADYFIVATGGSDRQVEALVDEVEDQLAKEDVLVKRIEGKKTSGWVLMDFGDIIVNVFTEEMRYKYNIEKVWGDCTTITLEEEE